MTNRVSSEIGYDCAIAGTAVVVNLQTVSLHGAGQIAVTQTVQMTGCSGSAVCRKFVNPLQFKDLFPRGCPMHDSTTRKR